MMVIRQLLADALFIEHWTRRTGRSAAVEAFALGGAGLFFLVRERAGGACGRVRVRTVKLDVILSWD
jgi:hypothetical protein